MEKVLLISIDRLFQINSTLISIWGGDIACDSALRCTPYMILELNDRMFQHPATLTDPVISTLFLPSGLLRL